MELKVGLDNITMTAEVNPRKYLAFKSIVENHVGIIVSKAMTDMVSAYTKADGHVVLKIDYDKIKGQAFKARPFRVEFNPTKLRTIDKEILDAIIPYLEDIVISRADLAFDIFGVDCSQFIFEKRGQPVAKKLWLSKAGDLETKYLGASRSERQVRFYNKKLERWENGRAGEKEFSSQIDHWWRLEFQLRSRAVDNIFGVLDDLVFKPADFSELPVEVQIFLHAYQTNPILFQQLSKNTRMKYRKIIENHKSSDTDYVRLLKELLVQERPRLENELAYYAGHVGQEI